MTWRINSALRILAWCAIASAVASSANAATLFSQTPSIDGAVSSDIAPSDFYPPLFTSAAAFSLTQTSVVTSATWRGTYTGAFGANPLPVDDFTINFYSDSGLPGDLLQSYAIGNDVNRSEDLQIPNTFDVYEYSTELSTGMRLEPGTYWISIFNNTDEPGYEDQEFLWALDQSRFSESIVITALSRDLGASWNSQGSDNLIQSSPLYFVLEGTVVPLPPGVLLLGSALALLGAAARRRLADPKPAHRRPPVKLRV